MALELIKRNLLNLIQVSAEVNAALQDHTLVVVTKKKERRDSGYPVYDIYACQGKLEGDQIKKE